MRSRFVVLLLVVLVPAAAGCGRRRAGAGVEPTITPTAVTTAAASTTTGASSTTSAPAMAAAGPTTVPPGDRGQLVEHLVTYGGLERRYLVYVPSTLRSGPAPLVVALHGGFGTAQGFADITGFPALAEEKGFVVVFPEGANLPVGPVSIRSWNGGDCCGPAAAAHVDDVGFVVAVITEVEASLPIDPGRVFVTGHSNGAILAWRLACERSDLFAAAAPVAGSLELSSCRPRRGVSLLAIHGDADQNHPIDGGRGPRTNIKGEFRSLSSSLDAWTTAEECGGPSQTVSGPLTETTWSGCREGTSTEAIVIAGADHPWPGARVNPAPKLQGQPSQALDATAAVWSFFAAHGR